MSNGFHLCRATHVQNEDGSVVLLSASNPCQRNAIAKRLLTPSKEGSLGGAAKKVCCIEIPRIDYNGRPSAISGSKGHMSGQLIF